MKNRFYIGLLIFTIAVSCTDENKSTENSNDEVLPETEIVSEIKTPHALEKNDGRKWKVSKGMQKPIEKIIDKVEAFNGSALVDYQLLGDAIGKQTNKVISNCNMTGMAHDELHKWLLPFLDLKEALVMASSPEEGAAILEHIQTELDVFDDYFK